MAEAFLKGSHNEINGIKYNIQQLFQINSLLIAKMGSEDPAFLS